MAVGGDDDSMERDFAARLRLAHSPSPATPAAASSPTAAGVTPAAAAKIHAQGREPERRDLVPVQPHEPRELAPHLVEPRRRC